MAPLVCDDAARLAAGRVEAPAAPRVAPRPAARRARVNVRMGVTAGGKIGGAARTAMPERTAPGGLLAAEHRL
jgi:hypothetical protein